MHSNQSSKFRRKNWVKINDESKGGYTTGCDIKIKTTMLRSSLCDHADADIHSKGKITITRARMMMVRDEEMKEIKV